MKRTMLRAAVLAILSLGWAASASAMTMARQDFVCPIDGEEFQADVAMSGTQFGRQLDRKPIGPMPAPWPLPKCPTSGFVMFKREFTADEVAKFKRFVATAEYSQMQAVETDYFLAARLSQFLGEPDEDVAWRLLQATWEARPGGAQYQRYAGEALKAFKRLLARSALDAATRLNGQLLAGELERRLERFDEAKIRFVELQKQPGLDAAVVRTIEQQLELIDRQDPGPAQAR